MATISLTATAVLQHSNMTPPTVPNSEGATLVDAFTSRIFDIMNFIILCGLVGLFGSISNIINIVIFFRLGILSSVSNLNLFSLAIADFGLSITTFLHSVCFSLMTANIPNLSWDPFSVFYLTVFLPNSIFLMASRLVTPYVAFERCICVVFPFKVRTLFTVRRSFIVNVIIFAYAIVSMVPRFATASLQYVIQGETNLTKLVLVFAPEKDSVYEIYIQSNVIGLSFASASFIFVVTIITSSGIKMSKKWRKSVSSQPDQKQSLDKPNPSGDVEPVDTSKAERMSDERIDKETRLVKMITTISIVYFVLYVPEFMIIIANSIDERISTFGQYWRLAHLLYSINIPIGSFNSGVNIFFYYRMSTAYRQEFRKLAGLSKA